MKSLENYKLYLTSPFYLPNESLSYCVMIDNESVICFPISQQIINEKNNNLIYYGNRYIERECETYKNVTKIATILGNRLHSIYYRGICGFDFIIFNGNIMLVEINPRYQGSSYLLNYVMFENKLPSLFELNTECFKNGLNNKIKKALSEIEIKIENHYYFNENKTIEIPNIVSSSKSILFNDGFDKAEEYEDNVYLFRYMLFVD